MNTFEKKTLVSRWVSLSSFLGIGAWVSIHHETPQNQIGNVNGLQY